MSATLETAGARRHAKPDLARFAPGRRLATNARVASGAILLCVIAGVAVRLAAARGDLWVDEIWSLSLVGAISSADEVFWNIAHDNNHYLNSLWLFLIGPDRPALVDRLPAVIFGGLSVAAAGQWGLRQSTAPGVAAALLVAFSFPFVNYGSEARGYAGLILAALLALNAMETALATPAAEPQARRGAWRLAGAMAFGTLSHFTMGAAAGLIGATMVLRLRRAGAAWSGAIGQTVSLLRPTLLLLLPIAATVAIGIARKGGMTMGAVVPFTLDNFLQGLGTLTSTLLGLPPITPPLVALIAAAVGLAAAFVARLIRPTTGLLGAVALAIPLLMLLARLPNTEQPRYFLVSGIVLTLVVAEIVGTAWQRGPALRLAVGSGFVALLIGQALLDATLIRFGRGSPSAAAAMMVQGGDARYASNADFRTKLVLDYVTRGWPSRPVLAPVSDHAAFCTEPPAWLVYDQENTEAPVAETLTVGPKTCRAVFVKRHSFPANGLSGRNWVLFHRY